jgi:hypothetical protein
MDEIDSFEKICPSIAGVRYKVPGRGQSGVQFQGIANLLSRVILSLFCPLTPVTNSLLCRKRLSQHSVPRSKTFNGVTIKVSSMASVSLSATLSAPISRESFSSASRFWHNLRASRNIDFAALCDLGALMCYLKVFQLPGTCEQDLGHSPSKFETHLCAGIQLRGP